VERGRVEVEFRRPGAITPGIGAREVAALLAWLHPDLMADALMAEVDALGIEAGISEAERERRTTDLHGKMADIERAEEAIVEAAAAQGQDIPRRPAGRGLSKGVLHPSRKWPNAANGRTRSQMILVTASIGTERIAPGMPHIQNQKTSEMMTRTGLRVNRLARSIGVTVSPSIKCNPR
jgi:hypothetical protein